MHIDKPIKVYIAPRDFGNSKNIYIVDRSVFGKRRVVKPMKIEWVEVEEGAEVPPSLSLGDELSLAFMPAMAEALAQDGIKTENDFKIAGLLEAKNYHLEDMRKLVFAQVDFMKSHEVKP